MSGIAMRSKGYTWSEPAIPGESLIGMVARNLERHGLDRLGVCLRPAVPDLGYPGSLPVAHHDMAAEIAELFRVDVQGVIARSHPPVATREGKRLISFFGVPLRETFHAVRERRVSPRSLSESAHHRALWHLRPLDFCPESRELLLSRCPDPSCGRALGWGVTLGPFRCEHCGLDLREHPQPKVDCADQEALDLVTDLVDPVPRGTTDVMARLPTSLAHCDRGELFEFAVMLADALHQVPGQNRMTRRRLRTRDDFGRLGARKLAEAGRVLLGWPASLHAVADGLREKATGRGQAQFGKFKELGSLQSLALDPMLPPGPGSALKAVLEANMRRSSYPLRTAPLRTDDQWITCREGAAEFGIHPKALRRITRRPDVEVRRGQRHSPVLVVRSMLAAVAVQVADSISLAGAQRLLGLDRVGVEQIAAAGMIRVVTGPASEVWPGERRFSKASLETLKTSVEAVALDVMPNGHDLVRLCRAVHRATSDTPCWPTILGLVLGGSLKVYGPEWDRHRPLATAVSVRIEDLKTLSSRIVSRPAAPSEDLTMSHRDAGILLQVSLPRINELVDAGHLRVVGSRKRHRRLVAASVVSFHDRYVMAAEAAELAGCGYRALGMRMANAGCMPVSRHGRFDSPLWDRRQVEGAFGPRQRM